MHSNDLIGSDGISHTAAKAGYEVHLDSLSEVGPEGQGLRQHRLWGHRGRSAWPRVDLKWGHDARRVPEAKRVTLEPFQLTSSHPRKQAPHRRTGGKCTAPVRRDPKWRRTGLPRAPRQGRLLKKPQAQGQATRHGRQELARIRRAEATRLERGVEKMNLQGRAWQPPYGVEGA